MVKSSIGITKYIIMGKFETKGYIDKPDLIGSFFGQTEGLIGEDLEFSELQQKGKLGRIEITLNKQDGNTKGTFTIPTSLDKVEVSLVAAAIESITKISHTAGEIRITEIRDNRKDKREAIKKRAEELLKNLKEELPESSEMTIDVSKKVRMLSIREYDKNVFGGPNIFDEEELILVEGVADVKNMLKHNFTNVLSFGGSNIPSFVKNISKNKTIIAFLDEDKGGRDELEELIDTANVSYYTFAPKGKDVEELNIKEINKCLQNKTKNEKQKKDLFSKIKYVIVKNTPIVEREIKKVRDIADNKINEFQKEVLYKAPKENNKLTTQEKKKFVNNIHLKRNEIEIIKKKIDIILKDNEKDFMILNYNLRCIKSGKLDELIKLEQLDNAKYLLFKGVIMSSILNKSKNIGIKIIISEKKPSKFDNSDIIIKLFSEVLEK